MIKRIVFIAGMIVGLAIGHAHAEEPKEVSPAQPVRPVIVWGVRGCGQEIIWIALSNGEVRRYDADHKPKPPITHDDFLAWIAQADTTDIVPLKCGVSL